MRSPRPPNANQFVHYNFSLEELIERKIPYPLPDIGLWPAAHKEEELAYPYPAENDATHQTDGHSSDRDEPVNMTSSLDEWRQQHPTSPLSNDDISVSHPPEMKFCTCLPSEEPVTPSLTTVSPAEIFSHLWEPDDTEPQPKISPPSPITSNDSIEGDTNSALSEIEFISPQNGLSPDDSLNVVHHGLDEAVTLRGTARIPNRQDGEEDVDAKDGVDQADVDAAPSPESEEHDFDYIPVTSPSASTLKQHVPKVSRQRFVVGVTPSLIPAPVEQLVKVFCGPRQKNTKAKFPDFHGSYVYASYAHSDLLLQVLRNLGCRDEYLQTPTGRCQFPDCTYGQGSAKGSFNTEHYQQRHLYTHLPEGVGYRAICPLCGDETPRGDNSSRHMKSCSMLWALSDSKSKEAQKALRKSYNGNLFLCLPRMDEVEAFIVEQQQTGIHSGGLDISLAEDAIRTAKAAAQRCTKKCGLTK